MPKREIEDFEKYWRESMFDVDSPRPAGGPTIIVDGVKGVDYSSKLIPWCKGNSISVDKNTIRTNVSLINCLVRNLHKNLLKLEQGLGKETLDSRSGITHYDLLHILKTKPTARGGGGRKYAPGEPMPGWKDAEKFFLRLLKAGHLLIYEDNNTLASSAMERIWSSFPDKVANMGIADWMGQGICQELSRGASKGAHLRLNMSFGWNTYVGDHFGAPAGILGVIAGSLQSELPASTIRTMPIPLHVCLAETIARMDARGIDNDPWGKNQTLIRRKIVDTAINNEGTDRIPLDQYYSIFSQNGASHMADTMMQRSRRDSAAAKFELEEITGSNPKRWNIILDPLFIRWRNIQREREVNR